MKRPKAILAEDEPLLRAELRETLQALWPELDIIAEAKDGGQAMQALRADIPDVLFLDIQMPGSSGIEIARAASGRCHVVFITAFDDYAVAAFEEGAVDYLMKPVTAARLATAIARIRQRMDWKPARIDGVLDTLVQRLEGGADNRYLRWVSVSRGQSIVLYTVEEVCYFQASGKYTLVATPDAQSLIRRTIRDLVAEVDPNLFWQVHRSTLVNLHAIAAVHRSVRGELTIRLKARPETLPVSAQHAHRFRQM
jgi:DNA-binding LytR/AlgR family response regulator